MNGEQQHHHQMMGISHRPRNPYAVLNIAPFDEEDARRKIDELQRTRRELRPEIHEQLTVQITDFADHPQVGRLEMLVAREREEREEAKERGQTSNLEMLLITWKDAIAIKQEIRLIDQQEAKRLQAAIDQARSTLPKRKGKKEPTQPKADLEQGQDVIVTVSPCIYDLREELKSLQERLKELLADGKRKRSHTKYQAASEAIDGVLEQHATAMKKRGHFIQYRDVHQAIIDKEDLIAAKQRQLVERYRMLAEQFHPDKNPDNPATEQLYKEVGAAYSTLKESTPAGLRKLATDLVFGQDTGTWTTEMQAVAKPVVEAFAAIFALELGIQAETVPCDTCNGQGAIPIQEREDYFPVPRRCLDCNGEGAILKVLDDIRRAVEGTVEEQ